MTIRQSAGLEPMHPDIRLAGWTRATQEDARHLEGMRLVDEMMRSLVERFVERSVAHGLAAMQVRGDRVEIVDIWPEPE